MTTLIINDDSPQAKKFLEYASTLPFAEVIPAKKKSFEEAVAECNGITVDKFIGELRRQVDEHFAKNA